MAIKINDFTITEFLSVDAFIRSTGALDFTLEELQDMTLTHSQEKQALTGKNGRVIGYKKRNKALSGTGTYGLISAPLMAAQTGGDITTGTMTVKKSETKEVSGATLVTDAVAVGTAGAEIGYLQALNKIGAVTATYSQGATADATHFTYDPETKTITLPINGSTAVIENGTAVVYAYTREVDGTKVTDPSDKYSQVRELWIHCFGVDGCDNEYYADIYIPRADLSGDFELALGGDQTTHNFSFDAMADLCNKTTSTNLFELIVYSEATGE